MRRLRAQLEQLIYETEWPDDKQRQWLRNHGGIDSWGEASESLIKKAIEKLKFANSAIDTSIVPVHDDERDDLRIYQEDDE